MSITLENYSAQDKKIMKKLYISAFPAEERAPFFMVVSKAKKGRAELLTVRKNGNFAGLTNPLKITVSVQADIIFICAADLKICRVL